MKLLITSLLTLISVLPTMAQTFIGSSGQISFTSDAPLEVIQATSKRVKGALDASKNTFAFTMPIVSFEGFNSALQREHFNENYMESAKYPEATFSGKIIEQVDLSKKGKQQVRAKGVLKIHGVEQERIIKSEITVLNDKTIVVTSEFTVPLADHNIQIPKIVNQKIATDIQVILKTELVVK